MRCCIGTRAGIESALEKIAATWDVLCLDMVVLREGQDIMKLRSADDVFAALEDNVVTLSTMKASKFFMVFEAQITKWEQCLSLVSEMIEAIIKVQQAWVYLGAFLATSTLHPALRAPQPHTTRLDSTRRRRHAHPPPDSRPTPPAENIFLGSEDIRRQLPAESAIFDAVNTTFIESMREMAETGNVVRATHLPGMMATFTDMDGKLERIQKSLDSYLEKKRQQFPRCVVLPLFHPTPRNSSALSSTPRQRVQAWCQSYFAACWRERALTTRSHLTGSTSFPATTCWRSSGRPRTR